MKTIAITFPDSPTAPYVLAFARLMERKLDQNRHKGNREGWIQDSPMALLRRLREELDELERSRTADAPGEAADVGNFAMMVADACGGIAPESTVSVEALVEASHRVCAVDEDWLRVAVEAGATAASLGLSQAIDRLRAALDGSHPAVPRAPGIDQLQADRDTARAELARMTAERDAIASDHDATASRVREAIDAVFENERRAISKGSAPYERLFLRVTLHERVAEALRPPQSDSLISALASEPVGSGDGVTAWDTEKAEVTR
jgi:hypothetical protein